MAVLVRTFEEQDAARIAQLMDDFQDYLVRNDDLGRLRRLPGYGANALQLAQHSMVKHGGRIYVAEDGDEIVGFAIALLMSTPSAAAGFSAHPERRGRIEELYVAPEHRGKKIASLLMAETEKYLKENGCEAVYLGVLSFNTNAYDMYEHMGYDEAGIELMKRLKP